MVSSVLGMCNGNICRPPVAKAALRAPLPGRHLSSADLHTLEGHGIYADRAAVAQRRDIPLSDPAARQFTTGIGDDIPDRYWMGAGMHQCAVNMVLDSVVHWVPPPDAKLNERYPE